MKKLNTFRKGYLVYLGILLVIGISFSVYVVSSLKQYENNQINTYIKNELKRNSSIDTSSFSISEYESSKDIKMALKDLASKTKITYKQKEKNHYIVSSDGVAVIDLVVEEGKSVSRLGILSFNVLSTKEMKFINEKGIYSYQVSIPSDYTVVVNGKNVKKDENTKEENLVGYLDVKSQSAPKHSVYELNGFINKPEIVIKDSNGTVVEAIVKDNTITSSNYFTTNDTKEAMSKLIHDFDVMSLAKDYSLFMTNDLSGGTRGFSKLEKYFIKDTAMYKLAYGWATGVDITFISEHQFKNPMFSNEKLSNFKIYNDKAFSVLVHLDKNMIVKGKDRVDTMNDEWFFVYENGWKLVDMQYINEGN